MMDSLSFFTRCILYFQFRYFVGFLMSLQKFFFPLLHCIVTGVGISWEAALTRILWGKNKRRAAYKAPLDTGSLKMFPNLGTVNGREKWWKWIRRWPVAIWCKNMGSLHYDVISIAGDTWEGKVGNPDAARSSDNALVALQYAAKQDQPLSGSDCHTLGKVYRQAVHHLQSWHIAIR